MPIAPRNKLSYLHIRRRTFGKTRNLGNTGIKLSEVGYGAAALFGKNVFGKQGITDDYAYEIISTAIKHGVTF